MADSKALIVGISGCSSSGKTTLARLLHDIFPNAFILHEDDFYKPEVELPLTDGLIDWDSPASINIPAMTDALAYIHEHAAFPPTLDSYQEGNSVGACPVPDSAVTSLKAHVASKLSPAHRLRSSALTLYLLDGFLLYAPSMRAIHPHLDAKLFVRASLAAAKRRREARDGYVTLEGFWSDPPGYVDRVVWPNYVEEHAWMFEGGDVEGQWRGDVLRSEGISVLKGADVDAGMEELLKWMVDEILELLNRQA